MILQIIMCKIKFSLKINQVEIYSQNPIKSKICTTFYKQVKLSVVSLYL